MTSDLGSDTLRIRNRYVKHMRDKTFSQSINLSFSNNISAFAASISCVYLELWPGDPASFLRVSWWGFRPAEEYFFDKFDFSSLWTFPHHFQHSSPGALSSRTQLFLALVKRSVHGQRDVLHNRESNWVQGEDSDDRQPISHSRISSIKVTSRKNGSLILRPEIEQWKRWGHQIHISLCHPEDRSLVLGYKQASKWRKKRVGACTKTTKQDWEL